MKTKALVVLLAAISIATIAYIMVERSHQAFSDASGQSETPEIALKGEVNPQVILAGEKSLEQSFTFKNLRLYPIRAKQAQESKTVNYLSLREALKAEKIKINEIDGGSGEVNTLYVTNVSKDTIYLMSGEIVQGGKQDRVIAEDKVIPPGEKEHAITVFCVEQGRWQYDDTADTKEFKQYYGAASMKMREVVALKKDQAEVWKEVSRSNQENAVTSETEAYTAQRKSGDYQKKYEEYYTFFKDKFAHETNIIGVTGVTGNRVIGSDMFANPTLFQKQFPSILSAYINEAITDGGSVQLRMAKVQEYMDTVFSVTADSTRTAEKYGKMFKYEGKALHYSTYSKLKK